MTGLRPGRETVTGLAGGGALVTAIGSRFAGEWTFGYEEPSLFHPGPFPADVAGVDGDTEAIEWFVR